MFKWFKKKSEKEVLEAKYKKLLEESFRLSHIDREASVDKNAEAEEILKQLEQLK